ncbi:uncharacterized protein N7459_003072 [Penicillium hispanicum]|uniref:uncharacterized protein n=1 Tax=Penicillium hispanicum TaxID=1080232 RepID=UPI002540545A|nr:uncharacterized protein N7459_003072 [Penicillium hispanicum]KAJ5587307.1 hypothetical protein N7459_003072 [Penicillium hispanicum]
MAATKAASSPLAQAIDEFLEGMKIRDRKNPFYEKVLTSRAVLALKDNPQGVQQCEDRLLESVKELEKQKRSTKTLKTLGTLTPFVDGLKSMIDACASLLQASPFAVGVAFTGASLVLSLAQKTNSLFENVFTALDEIGSCLQCYAKFSVAYETSDEVRERLVASYKTIVSFFSAATNLLSKNVSVLVGAFKNVFNPLAEPIDGTIETLRQDRDRVTAIAQAEEAVRANQRRIHEKAEEEKGILDWISAGDDLDVRGDVQMHTERRHSKTCSWLLEDEQFQRWRDSTPTTRDAGGSVFWYNAPPGSGKTVLSTAVIEHLNSRNSPTACFFYSFSDYTRRQALTALRAVAIQLLSILKTGIPGRVVELYHDEMSRNARYMQIPGIAIEVVHELLKQCSCVYVVVDGLDECLDDDKMRGMLTSIASAPTYGATKWFFTSRPDVHIRDMMSRLGALTVSPSVSTLQSDIRLFLADGLEHLPDKIDEYVEYSEGSFLYSRFLLDTLRGEGVTCEDDIRRALHAFPKGLTGYYVRSLLKLCERTDFEQELVQ